MKKLSDVEVLNYLQLARKISLLNFMLFLGIVIFKLDGVIGKFCLFFCSFVFVVLASMLYGLDMAHSDDNGVMQSEESHLEKATFKAISREKWLNRALFVITTFSYWS